MDVFNHYISNILCIKPSNNFLFFFKYWIHYSKRNAFSFVKEWETKRRLVFGGNGSGISTTSRFVWKNKIKSLTEYIKPSTQGGKDGLCVHHEKKNDCGRFPNLVLRREIPMAWGTTTDSLTPEINPFRYAIEIKCLTLKDQTSYLIPDGWSRSPLSFPIFSLNWYITSSTTSKQYKHTIYHGVRSILAYIINNVKVFDICKWIQYSIKYSSLDKER